MGRLASCLTDAWRRRALSRPRIDRVVRCESQHEVPGSIPRHTLVVVGSEQTPKWAIFECPCGSGHRIMVSLVPTHRSHWHLEHTSAAPSLFPSVNSHDSHGRCHFWLRDGRVDFTRDSLRPPDRRAPAKGRK
jgi:hypothetical protein